MWADTQRDGRGTEYRWRHMLNAAVWLTLIACVSCSNAANFAPGKIPLGARAPENVYIRVHSVRVQEMAKYRAKFG